MLASSVVAALVLAGCQEAKPSGGKPAGRVAPAAGGTTSAPAPVQKITASAPATQPAEATLALADLPPRLEKPADAADADKVSARAAEILADAEKDFAARNYVQAAEKLERARGFDPKSARLQRQLGLTYAALGDSAKAEPLLAASVKDAPDHVAVNLLLGTYASARRDGRQAAIFLRRALMCSDATDQRPETAEALYRLAGILEQQGYYAASAECHERFARLMAANDRQWQASDRPTLRGIVAQPEQQMIAYGRVLLKLGRNAQAAEQIEKAYRRNKSNPEAARLVVKAMLLKGDLSAAQSVLMEMLQEPAMRDQATDAAVEYCRERKDAKLPYKLLDSYSSHGGSDADFVLAMIEVAAELGSKENPATAVSKYLGEAAQQGDILLRLAKLYANVGDAKSTVTQLAALIDSNAPELSLAPLELRLAARKLKKDAVLAEATNAAAPRRAAVGLLLEIMGQSDPAADVLKKVIADQPTLLGAYEPLLRIYMAKSADKEADALLDGLKTASSASPFYYYLHGQQLLARGQIVEAVKELETARRTSDKHVPTLVLLGRACLRGGATQQAEVYLAQAYTLDANNPLVVREIFDMYISSGRRPEAKEVLDKFTQASPASLTGRLLQARYNLIAGNADQARQQVAALKADLPDDPDIRLLDLYLDLPLSIGKQPLPADKAKTAIEKAQALLKLEPANLQISLILTALLENQKQYADAAAVLEKMHAKSPKDVILIYRYLDALTKAKQYDQAQKLLDEWLGWATATGDKFAIRGRKLRLYVEAAQYDPANKFADRWVKEVQADGSLAPRQVELTQAIRLALINALSDAKVYDKALTTVEGWLAQPSMDKKSLQLFQVMKAELLGKQNKIKELLDFGKKWIAQNPADDIANSAIIAALTDSEKYDEALKLAEDWLVVETKAASQPASAPSVEPTNPDDNAPEPLGARGYIVRINLLAQRNKVALDRVRQFVKQDEKDIRLLKLLYATLSANDMEKEGIDVMEKIYSLAPDDVGINNDLGYSLADRGVQLDRAEEMIRKALEARNDTAFQDSFGWVLYKRGKIQEAKDVFDQVMADQPSDADDGHAVIADHAGDVYWRSGLTDKAVECWKQAVDLAKKQKRPDKDSKAILDKTAAKLQAVQKKQTPSVAPLGEGILLEK